MDEESGLWPYLSRIFGAKNGHTIEQRIEEAAQGGELKADEMAMLLNVLRLGRKQVSDIMIPRTDIVCVELSQTLPEAMQTIVASGHSRIPVYKENRDNIVGILYAKDVLKVLFARTDAPADDLPGGEHADASSSDSPASAPPQMVASLRDIPLAPSSCKSYRDISACMREPFFVPETKNVKVLIQEFRSRKVHLAIALDEYGGTSGLVTLEDLLEEIVGEIEDEYDAPRPDEIQPIDGGGYQVSGRALLTDLADETGVMLESEQVETVGGYLSELAGRVPRQGEVFAIDEWRFEVSEADAKQVHTTVLTPHVEEKLATMVEPQGEMESITPRDLPFTHQAKDSATPLREDD